MYFNRDTPDEFCLIWLILKEAVLVDFLQDLD